MLERRIGEIVKGVCDAHGAEFNYKFDRLFPPLINNTDICDMLYNAGVRCLGKENCVYGGAATMAGEEMCIRDRKKLYLKRTFPKCLRNRAIMVSGVTMPINVQ